MQGCFLSFFFFPLSFFLSFFSLYEFHPKVKMFAGLWVNTIRDHIDKSSVELYGVNGK